MRLLVKATVALLLVVALEEERLDRPGAIEHLPQQPQQRDDVALARPAMDDAVEGRGVAADVEAPQPLGRRRTDHREHALDRLEDAGDAAERKRAGDEADDLAVVVALEASDDLNRIGRRVGVVEVGVELVERGFQPASLNQDPAFWAWQWL